MVENNLKSPLFMEERRYMILQIILERSKVLVHELCDLFEVSPATIRNDLRELEKQGRLKRTHGGAMLLEKAGFEPVFVTKKVKNIEQKKAIALKALELIEDGDSIALDSSSTTIAELVYVLTEKKDLSIVTNDIELALYLEDKTRVTVILVGGTIRRGFSCTTGPITVREISKLNVDKAFMATNAFSLDRGFTTPNIEHAEVKKSILSIASQKIMLMDSSKVGHIRFMKFADLDELDTIITDDNLPPGVLNSIKEHHPSVELILV